MQINISTRHGHLNQEAQEKITEKVAKLPRIFERLTAATVTVDLEHKDTAEVEINLSVERTNDFIATGASNSVMSAVDGTIHKLEQQLRKHKEKLKGHKVTGHKHHESFLESDSEESVRADED